ncbi:unnamed protein product [Lactuca virosa]|uniref:Uncharacterized protein n=1 Tax=Lactuca virosa TaxID=75947 RepID=A0AAU9PR03_9ASTR|nr:unnamed protein product [Lactuca virosa]
MLIDTGALLEVHGSSSLASQTLLRFFLFIFSPIYELLDLCLVNAFLLGERRNYIFQVVDSAELSHPDRDLVDEALKASIRVNGYLHVSI